MVENFSGWLTTTTLSWAVRGGVPWLWPLCEILHFMGMATLVGIVGMLDLRMIGVAKGLPVGPLNKLMPWGIAGFILNLITGFMFFAGAPQQYIGDAETPANPAFLMKMLFIFLAGLNVIVYYMSGLYRKVDPIGAGQDVPFAAKLVGATSLFLWIGVMYWGRMLPFLGDTF